jgi:ribulose-5-phosphate 4-epimerase/fuculose-1-phosphate aldolase
MRRDMGSNVSFRSLKGEVSHEEWEVRLALAACYRLVDHFGYNVTSANHITARVPGEPDHFLINPGGYLFSEICASSLVKIDLEGNILSEAPTGIVNPAGYVIHSAVLSARPDVNCVVHLHTVPGIAISAQKHGLRFLCQESLRFYGRLGFHEYEGVARKTSERERLSRDLGDNFVLILRNHGSLVVGRTVAEAFNLTMSYERSCEIQLAAQSSNDELVLPPQDVCQKAANHHDARNVPIGDAAWKAYRRIADFRYPSYKN